MKILYLHKETNGQAMTEFIIVFPSLFLLFLVIIQTTLLMTAKQMVEYSAFCAARSAIVYNGNDKKIKRAADIACISISPKMTPDILMEFVNYAAGLGEMVIDTVELIDDYPSLAGLVFTWSDLPGMEIIDKLRNTRYEDIINQNNAKLAAGLLFIDTLGGYVTEGRVTLRYPIATLLTDQTVTNSGRDATVEIKHNYAMRVPIVNKLFFYGYIYGKLRNEIRSRLSNYNLPAGAIDEITSNALRGLRTLADASNGGSLYLLPIIANCTLTVENDADTMKNCD